MRNKSWRSLKIIMVGCVWITVTYYFHQGFAALVSLSALLKPVSIGLKPGLELLCIFIKFTKVQLQQLIYLPWLQLHPDA